MMYLYYIEVLYCSHFLSPQVLFRLITPVSVECCGGRAKMEWRWGRGGLS